MTPIGMNASTDARHATEALTSSLATVFEALDIIRQQLRELRNDVTTEQQRRANWEAGMQRAFDERTGHLA